MSTNIKAAISDIESQMKDLKSQIDAVTEAGEPIRKDLEYLNTKVAETQALALKRADDLQRTRPQNWLEIKRKYGELASARMQLRSLLKE